MEAEDTNNSRAINNKIRDIIKDINNHKDINNNKAMVVGINNQEEWWDNKVGCKAKCSSNKTQQLWKHNKQLKVPGNWLTLTEMEN